MKKFSKKMLALICAMVMVVGCCVGCGSKETTDTTNDTETVVSDDTTTSDDTNEVDADTSDTSDGEESTDNSTSGPVDISKFILDGKVYSLPMTFDEMERISPLSSEILIGTPVIASYVPIETFGEDETDFELENGLKVGFSNTSGSEQEVSKCQNTLIRVTKDMDIQMDVNGITIGSTIDDVLKAFPIYDYYYSLTFGKVQLNEKGHYEILGDVENSFNEDYTSYNEDILNNESLFDASYSIEGYRITFIIENGKVIEITIATNNL